MQGQLCQTLRRQGLTLLRQQGGNRQLAIYEAVTPAGDCCTVKILPFPFAESEPPGQQILEILHQVRRLSQHPQLVGLLDFWVVHWHLVTCWDRRLFDFERTLLDVLETHRRQGRRGIPPGLLIPYLTKAAIGLDALNRQGFCHRDVRPENLLRLYDENVIVADTGLAHICRLAGLGLVCSQGLGYLPPEDYQHQQPSPGVDVYSLAATYLKLRTGNEPFGQDPVTAIRRQTQGKPELAHLSQEEAFCLQEALTPDAGKRPRQTCRQLMARLAQAARRARLLDQVPELLEHAFVLPAGRITSRDHSPETSATRRFPLPCPEIAAQERFGHQRAIRAVAFSPDGRLALTASEDATAILWETATGKIRHLLPGHEHQVLAAAFSPEGRYVLTGSWDTTAMLWDTSTGESVRVFPHGQPVWAVAFSPDGQHVLTFSQAEVQVWNKGSGTALWRSAFPLAVVSPPVVCASGGCVVTGTQKGAALWSCPRLQRRAVLPFPEHRLRPLALEEGGSRVLLRREDAELLLWDADSGRWKPFGAASGLRIVSAAFDPRGKLLLTGAEDGTAVLWDVRSGKRLRTFPGHAAAVSAVAFTPDGTRLLAGDENGVANLWQASGRKLRTLCVRQVPVHAGAWSSTGRFLLAGTDCGAVVWNVQEGKRPRRLGPQDKPVTAVAFAHGEDWALTAPAGDSVQMWDVPTGRELLTLRYPGHVTSLAFSPKGRYVLATGIQQEVTLWKAFLGSWEDWETWKRPGAAGPTRPQQSVPEETKAALQLWRRVFFRTLMEPWRKLALRAGPAAAINPRGTHVAASCASAPVAVVWDIDSARELFSLLGHLRPVTAICYSPDGALLLTGSEDKQAILWDALTGERLLDLQGHRQAITAVAFNPRGQVALTGSRDATVLLWDVNTGSAIGALEGHKDAITAVAFNPEGSTVLTASRDGSLRLWDTRTPRELLRWWCLAQGNWLVVTAQGYFHGSPGALNLIRHRDVKTGQLLPREASQEYHRPDKVAEVLAAVTAPPNEPTPST